MDLESRIQQSQTTFDDLQAKRSQLLEQAEGCMTEMTKLQGEYRLLIELRDEQNKKSNKKATVIEAVPEEK